MATTMMSNPVPQSKPSSDWHPVPARRASASGELNTKTQGQLRRDRISAAVAVLLMLVMVLIVVWAALASNSASPNTMWDVPGLY